MLWRSCAPYRVPSWSVLLDKNREGCSVTPPVRTCRGTTDAKAPPGGGCPPLSSGLLNPAAVVAVTSEV